MRRLSVFPLAVVSLWQTPTLLAQSNPESRPAPEQRLADVQAATPVASPTPLPVLPGDGSRPIPEMRLLAQAADDSQQRPADSQTPQTDESGPGRSSGGPGGGRGFGGRPGGGFGGPPGGGLGAPGSGVPGPAGSGAPDETMRIEDGKVVLQFPNNPVSDLLLIYERLTEMTLIKDTNIFNGATISLVTPVPVEQSEAIRLIEASLLTNGYAIVLDPGGKSARILPARDASSGAVQFSHGVSFYQSASDLPDGETIVTYFMPLENLDPAEAAEILANHVGLSVYGRVTPVLTPPGLLLTESATIIRQLISIRETIDSEAGSSALITKFIPLNHADATVVAQIVQATVSAQAEEQEARGVSTFRGSPSSAAPTDGKPKSDDKNSERGSSDSRGGAVAVGRTGSADIPSPSAQVVADSRLNQVLVVASPEDYTYIASLIAEFDRPLTVEEPYERHLKYASAIDILPSLVDVLNEAAGSAAQLPGGGTVQGGSGQPVTSSSSQLLGGVRTSQSRGGQVTSTSSGAADDLSSGASSSLGSRPDVIQGPTEDNAPISVLINKTRIVADPMANAILVMGRKENIEKINALIDKLDRKPAQVYLSTVIGQLTLGEGMETGIDYLVRYNQFGSDFGGAGSLFNSRQDVINNNNVSDLRDNLITSAFGPVNGLNLYGAIGDSVDVFVSALETNNRFKVLSRPAVFALNNKKATITSGQLIPVPAQSTTFVGNGANASNVTTTIDYRDVVLKLEVVPLINADGEVNLTIAQVNDTVIGTQRVEPNDIPIIGTEQIVTSVTIPNGNTVVLGGLISEEETNDRSGLPYISRVPLLGKLFRQDSDSTTRRELIIFIQPRVVTDDMSLFDASRSEDYRTEIGRNAAERFPNDVDLTPPTAEEVRQDKGNFFSRIFRSPSRRSSLNGKR